MMTRKEFEVQAVLSLVAAGNTCGPPQILFSARALADELDGRGYFEDDPKAPCALRGYKSA